VLRGTPPPGVSAKDAALEIVGQLGADGATYMAVEIHLTDGAEAFGRGERMTLANLMMEAGAKAGLVVPSGEILELYDVPDWLYPDDDAHYEKTLEIDLSQLRPRLAAPFYVDNVHPVTEYAGTEIDYVFVGTCTNGRLEDLRELAEVLKGRRVAPGVRLLVVPASDQVLRDALKEGIVETLIEAGAVLGTPGCGPCMGRHLGVAAEGERVVSTANRNFKGRMGAPSAEVFLASPRTAGLAAVLGRIPGEEEL
jgi:methanogen homoaconitase large subunit